MPLLRCAHILFLALILPLAGIGPLLVSSARADVIELRADPWCPFNCTPGSAAPGFMVELAREALAPFGHEVRYAQLNWSRSLVKVRSGEITGLIGTDPSEVPELIFSPPLGQYQEALGFRRGELREITRISELAGLRLGATRDYDYTTEVLAHIAARSPEPGEIQLLSGNDAPARNLRKLLPHAQSSPLHIGFSPRHPRSAFYVRQMEQGLAALRRSGRYGLKG